MGDTLLLFPCLIVAIFLSKITLQIPGTKISALALFLDKVWPTFAGRMKRVLIQIHKMLLFLWVYSG